MPPNVHLLLVPVPAWGHSRPLLALAARIVSEREDVVVTIFTTSYNFDKSRFEIERQLENNSPALQPSGLMEMMGLLEKSYPDAYNRLAQSKSITCATTGTCFEAVSVPVAVILDFLALAQLKATRALTGSSIPVIAWAANSGSSLLRIWGPESMGGLENFSFKVDAEAARTGKSPLEVGEQLYRSTDEAIVRVPGVPAMYGYEIFAQKVPPEFSLFVLARSYEFFMESDALLIASSDAYEQESLNAVREWLSHLDKLVYAVGPLVPLGHKSTQPDSKSKGADVVAFLDNMLAKHGMRSMVFISFGSELWPMASEQLEEVIEALIETKNPFVLSCASVYSKVSTELCHKIQSSGIGLLTSWAPQQFILNHPVTGWFLTHGGHGGITESLVHGIPMICWPFFGDQPISAAHLTDNLRVAFELFEVRTGDGLRPLYRNSLTPTGTREALSIEIRRVLEACFGKEGRDMRSNAERLKAAFVSNWTEQGASRVSLNEFLNKYT